MNCVLTLLFLGILQFRVCASERKPPHIVFILVDDLGYNDIGYSPYSDGIETPTIDRLAKEGLRLTWSYTPWVCTPSRAAIMAGFYPYRYGMQGGSLSDATPRGLDLDYKLLPQYLKEIGYQTHMVGKWHLGHCKEEYTPLNRGFDSFRGLLGGHDGYYDHSIDGEVMDYWKNRDLVFNDIYSTDDFGNYTKNLIKENKSSKPMFLYLSLQAVHAPLDKPPQMPKIQYQNKYREIFREMVRSVGNFTNVVVSALKEKDMWDDTILIFTSDNGGQPMFGGNNYPLRGAKAALWEGGQRIRSFLSGYEIPKGEYSGLFHSIDWLPTILSMAGKKLESIHFDGKDQWQALKKNKKLLKNQPRKSFFYNVHEEEDGTARSGVRARFEKNGHFEDYKLILGHPGAVSDRIKPDFNWFQDEKTLSSPVTLLEGALFDMNLPDEQLEEVEVKNKENVKQQLMEMIENEKKGKWEMAKKNENVKNWIMKTKKGQKYLGPTWC